MAPLPPQTPKKLKVLVLSAKGWGTGSALRAFYLSEALRKRGHEVDFVRPLPTFPFWLDMALSTFTTFFATFLSRYDGVLCVKPYPTVVPTLWLHRQKGARIVIDVDDLDYAYSRGAFRRFHQWLQTPWPRWADLVTYHNPHLREPLLADFGVPKDKLLQVPQGVDFDIFHPGPPAPEDLPTLTAEWLAYQSSCRTLCFTAHLNNACDLSPVLKAFSLLLSPLPNARLLVAGGGPDRDRFEHQAELLGINGFLHFTGAITPRQVAACLKASDLALAYYADTPANSHRASMKLREALACGVRVLATSVGEAKDWKGALFLSNPSPAAYAQAIPGALSSKNPPRGGARLVKKWSWTDCVRGLEKALERRKDA